MSDNRRDELRTRQLAILASHEVGLAKFYVINAIADGPRNPDSLLAFTVASTEGDPRGTVSISQFSVALTDCMEAGLCRLIDGAALQEIEATISGLGGIGPLNRLPEIGDVDFTDRGSQLFREIDRALWPEARYWIAVGEDTEWELYAETLDCLNEKMQEWRPRWELEWAGKPEEIGRWFVLWWRAFASGYRVKCRRTRA